MHRWAVVGMAVAILVGCRSVPFQETRLVSLAGVDPDWLREQFALAVPVTFRIVNTVTFEFKGHAFAAIGYTDVDTSKQTFTVVGLHPAGGIKLFEISGDSEDVDCRFAVEELSTRGDFARAVADDTRRMYFDRVPSPDAEIFEERLRIVFRQDAAEGEIEYVFAGSDGVLIKKRYYQDGNKIWSVSYYEYRRERGKLYPEGIIFEHHDYGYRLVIRLREIRS